MIKTHTKLVNTNAVAIKNSKILSRKLHTSTQEVVSLRETIKIQKLTIENLNSTLDGVELRMKNLQENITPEYDSLVNTKARDMVIDIVEKHCNAQSINTQIQTITTNTIKETSEAQIKVIVDASCEIMQEKANSITASVDTHVNGQNTSVVTPPLAHEPEIRDRRNNIFPNVHRKPA